MALGKMRKNEEGPDSEIDSDSGPDLRLTLFSRAGGR
jgi:hypothetical protein